MVIYNNRSVETTPRFNKKKSVTQIYFDCCLQNKIHLQSMSPEVFLALGGIDRITFDSALEISHNDMFPFAI